MVFLVGAGCTTSGGSQTGKGKTTFEVVSSGTDSHARAYSIYVTNPTKGEIQLYCEQKKNEFDKDPSSLNGLYIAFFTDKAKAPVFVNSATATQVAGPELEPYVVASYFYSKTSGDNGGPSFPKPMPD